MLFRHRFLVSVRVRLFDDFNCERLKNAKTLYDMGMKVAAVSVMCQDERIFDAMMDAGSPLSVRRNDWGYGERSLEGRS